MSESGGAARRAMVVLGAAVVALVMAAVAGWAVLGSRSAGPRPPSGAPPLDELTVNVEQIRQAELTLKNVFGSFTPCSSRAEASALASKSPRTWTSSPCWVSIGWQPDSEIRGGYWVEVDADGFTAYGVGPDGAEIRATASAPAAPAP